MFNRKAVLIIVACVGL